MIRINPILQRELKQNARTKRTVVLITGVTGFLLLFALLFIYYIFERTGQQNIKSALSIYLMSSALLFLAVLLITPAIMAGSITQERERQTYDLLLCAKITPIAIVRGKLLSGVSLMTLLLFAALPVFGLMFFLGGITIYEIFQFYGLLLLAVFFTGSISIFYSSFCKKTMVASVFTYLTILFLTAGLGALIFWQSFDSTAGMNSGSYLLLTTNPIFTYLTLVEKQIGTILFPQTHLTMKNEISYQMYTNFISYSVGVQIVLSVIFNLLSVRMLKKRHE